MRSNGNAMKCYLTKNGQLLDFQKKQMELHKVWNWEIELSKGVTFGSCMQTILDAKETITILLASLPNNVNPLFIAEEWLYLKDRVTQLEETDEEYIDFLKIRWVAEEFESGRKELDGLEIYTVMVGVFQSPEHNETKYVTLTSPAKLSNKEIVLEQTIRIYNTLNDKESKFSMTMKVKDVFTAIMSEFSFYGNPFVRYAKRIEYERLIRSFKD